MPTIDELLGQLGFLSHELAVASILITGAALVLIRDWRFSLLALLAQYLGAGVLLTRMVLPEIALIQVLNGALICPMLYLAARQARWEEAGAQGLASSRSSLLLNFPFRLMASILIMLLAIMLNQNLPVPGRSAGIGLGIYWLILVGLLLLILTEDPIKAGIGLLTTSTGFELLYAPLERSLAVVWMWAIVNLLLALAISYLAVVRSMKNVDGKK